MLTLSPHRITKACKKFNPQNVEILILRERILRIYISARIVKEKDSNQVKQTLILWRDG